MQPRLRDAPVTRTVPAETSNFRRLFGVNPPKCEADYLSLPGHIASALVPDERDAVVGGLG